MPRGSFAGSCVFHFLNNYHINFIIIDMRSVQSTQECKCSLELCRKRMPCFAFPFAAAGKVNALP